MADVRFTDPALQQAYRALMRESRGGAHIDESTWDRIAADEIDASGRDAAFDHIVSCASCARAWHGIQELQRAAISDGLLAPPLPAASAWSSTRIASLAVAATLVLAVGAAIVVRQQATQPEVTRSAAALPRVEGLMMAYSAQGVPTFVWAPVPTATRYRLEVFTDDGRPVWSGDAQYPTAEWPSNVQRPKGAYRWRVEALNGDGPIARSPLTAVEIPR